MNRMFAFVRHGKMPMGAKKALSLRPKLVLGFLAAVVCVQVFFLYTWPRTFNATLASSTSSLPVPLDLDEFESAVRKLGKLSSLWRLASTGQACDCRSLYNAMNRSNRFLPGGTPTVQAVPLFANCDFPFQEWRYKDWSLNSKALKAGNRVFMSDSELPSSLLGMTPTRTSQIHRNNSPLLMMTVDPSIPSSPASSFSSLPLKVSHAAFLVACSNHALPHCPSYATRKSVWRSVQTLLSVWLRTQSKVALWGLTDFFISEAAFQELTAAMPRSPGAGTSSQAILLLVQRDLFIEEQHTSSGLPPALPSLPMPFTSRNNIPNLQHYTAEPTVSQSQASLMSHIFMSGQQSGNRDEVLCTDAGYCYCTGGRRFASGKCQQVGSSNKGLFHALQKSVATTHAAVKGMVDAPPLLLMHAATWRGRSIVDLSGCSHTVLIQAALDSGANVTCVCTTRNAAEVQMVDAADRGETLYCAADKLRESGELHIVHLDRQDEGIVHTLQSAAPATGWDVAVALGVLQHAETQATVAMASVLSHSMAATSFVLLSSSTFEPSHKRPWHEPWSLESELLDAKFSALWSMKGQQAETDFGCVNCNVIWGSVSGSRGTHFAPVKVATDWNYLQMIPGVKSPECINNDERFEVGAVAEQMEFMRAFGKLQPFDTRVFVDNIDEFLTAVSSHAAVPTLQPTESEFEEFPRVVDWQQAEGSTSSQRGNSSADRSDSTGVERQTVSPSDSFEQRWVVYPDFVKATHGSFQDDITLCTHMDMSRINLIPLLCEAWGTSISISIIVHSKFDSASALSQLHLIQRVPCVKQWVSVHLIKHLSGADVYAVNMARNTAVLQSQTDNFFMIDADFLPIEGTLDALRDAVGRHSQTDMREKPAVFVVLAAFSNFEVNSTIKFQNFTANVHASNRNAQYGIYPFTQEDTGASYTDFQTHAVTDYMAWKSADKPYTVPFVPGYEPYYVANIKRLDFPLWDERLKRWGGDKQIQIEALVARGYTLQVVPKAAIVHRPHSRTGRGGKEWIGDSLLNRRFTPVFEFMGLLRTFLPAIHRHTSFPLAQLSPCHRADVMYGNINGIRHVFEANRCFMNKICDKNFIAAAAEQMIKMPVVPNSGSSMRQEITKALERWSVWKAMKWRNLNGRYSK